MDMEHFLWNLQNQAMLRQIYLENRKYVRLTKNRIEKFRAKNKKYGYNINGL